MLTYVALVAHPPFLIPSVAPQEGPRYETIAQAMKRVGEDMQSLNVQTVVCITVHGERYEHALALPLREPYTANLHRFGVMESAVSIAPDVSLLDRLQRALRRASVPVTLTSPEVLDEATAVVLYTLHAYMHGMRVTIMTVPIQIHDTLTHMGDVVRDVLDAQPHSIALLCIGALSHRLSSLSPSGLHPQAEAFDTRVRHAVLDQNRSILKQIDDETHAAVEAHELDAIRLWMEIIGETRVSLREHAYAAPHGVGHLVASARV